MHHREEIVRAALDRIARYFCPRSFIRREIVPKYGYEGIAVEALLFMIKAQSVTHFMANNPPVQPIGRSILDRIFAVTVSVEKDAANPIWIVLHLQVMGGRRATDFHESNVRTRLPFADRISERLPTN